MNGELAQCLAIATHVTMWLADLSEGRSRSDDLPGIPQFADLVAFDSVAGIESWVERLAEDGVDRLWFAVAGLGIAERPAELPAPVSAAFVGGVPVGLLSTGPAGSRLWQAQWSAATRVADGAQILVANYLSEPTSIGPVQVSVDAATRELEHALRRAAQFADRQQLPTWARVFTEAGRYPAPDGSREDGVLGWPGWRWQAGCSGAWGRGTTSGSPTAVCSRSTNRSAWSCSRR
jgi:hypothetical protein